MGANTDKSLLLISGDDSNIAVGKAIMEVRHGYDFGPQRPPLLDLSDEDQKSLRKEIIEEINFFDRA